MHGLTMPSNDDKLDDILFAIRKKINSLISDRKTGKYMLTIEVNLSQGGIGDVFLTSTDKERVQFENSS